jgi:tetratricopeptide (TPR) repeat protein
MKRLIPILILTTGLASLYPLQRWIDGRMPKEVAGEETMFLTSGETIKKMSLGLDGLVADIYWIRTIQYFGRTLIESGKPLSSSATRDLDLPLLAPLLDIVTTLDPQMIPAYRFGAMFLPERDVPAAIALLEKGIHENPDEWQLYQDIGYIYWQLGNTSPGQEQADHYAKAAGYYDRGSQLPGARWWMGDLAGLMRIKGESREAARAIYQTYLESEDATIRDQAVARLKQLNALDEIDAINNALAEYQARAGKCPPDLRAFARVFKQMGINLDESGMPIDPDGFAYDLDPKTCKVGISFKSSLPR